MRISCLDCARKHLSSALVLEMEVKQGYPLHAWFAVGHMNEAADELVTDYPALAERVRAERIEYMASINRVIRLDDGEFVIDGEIYDMPLPDIIADITLQHIAELDDIPKNEDA